MAQEEKKKKTCSPSSVIGWSALLLFPPPEVFFFNSRFSFLFCFFFGSWDGEPGSSIDSPFFGKKKVGVGGVTKAWTMKEKAKKKK